MRFRYSLTLPSVLGFPLVVLGANDVTARAFVQYQTQGSHSSPHTPQDESSGPHRRPDPSATTPVGRVPEAGA